VLGYFLHKQNVFFISWHLSC